MTAYDRRTHALIKHMDRASRSSQLPEMRAGADGSVEVFFGPTAPPGMETNWVPSDPQGGFERMFRFYAPTPALFEKAWKLPDVGRID